MDLALLKEFGFPAVAFGAVLWFAKGTLAENTRAIRELAEAVANLHGYLQRMSGNGKS